MEDNKIKIIFEKNEFRFKILYIIRENLPKSEFLYLFMFFLKYIGLILFSISLNLFDTRNTNTNSSDKNSNFQENEQNKDDFHRKPQNNKNDVNSNNLIQTIFKNFLINGNNYKILNNSYQFVCIIGLLFLFIYLILWVFVYFYMKKKYFMKNEMSVTDKKLNEINQSDIFEKRIIKCLTYILFLIAFFHQYIIEYYIFGFLGYLLNLFDVLNKAEDKNSYDINDNYTKYIKSHLNKLIFPEIFIAFINFVTIVIILVIFIYFVLIHSYKTLYISKNYSLYSNRKNLFINTILLNFNPLYGIVNYFSNTTKLKFMFIFIIIIIFLILLKIIVNYYYFSLVPYKLEYLGIFIEFFALFGCITNIITYLSKSEINSTKFCITKAIFELLNALVFTFIFFKMKTKKNIKLFSDNLFSNNLKSLNPSGIYCFIERYIKYCQNKINNYMDIFELIQNHVLNCEDKDCPGNNLLPKSLSYSIFTNLKHYSNTNNISNKTTFHPNINNNKTNSNNYNIKSSESIKKSKFNSKKSKNNSKAKTIKVFDKNVNIVSKDDEDEMNINNNNKKILEDVEFKMIGEQEIINRINFLYRRKKFDYMPIYIFIHLQYIIKIKQNYRLALYFLSKYSKSEIKFDFLSQYYLYEIKNYINKSILNQGDINNIKDPYIKKYKEENMNLEQLIEYISLFNIVKKIIKVSCESIIQFYSFCRELHNSLSLQKYKNTKIYQVLQLSEKIQLSIFKLQFLLNKLNKSKKHSLESIELSYLICNFFKLLEGRVPQEILNNVKPILYFKDSLYEQLINEFHLFMMDNPLIISLTQKDTFDIIYFTNIFLKKLGFSFSDLKNKDFHEKLFPGNQELIKNHTLILKQFLFFYNNTYYKCNTFIKSKEGYLVPVNITTKVFPTFLYDFLLIVNVVFKNKLKNNNMNNNEVNNNKNDAHNNKLINTYYFMLNNDFEIFSLTKNFYLEYHLNQAMFKELNINFCQFFCINENKLSERIMFVRNKIIKENPNLNNNISLNESNKAYTIFQNISMKNLFKIRNEKLVITYNYPEILIFEKIDKKKLIKKIPEIMNIIDEIGLDYDWYLTLQKYKGRLYFNIDESKLKSNIYNHEQFFEVVFSIKRLGNILYYVVNLNEIYNNDIGTKKFLNKFTNKKTINNSNKRIQKKETIMSNNFNKTSIKSIDDKNRKSILSSRVYLSQDILRKINEDKNQKIPNTVIHTKMIGLNFEENKDKEKNVIDKNKIQNYKLQKNSIIDNTEYLKYTKNKKRYNLEDDENTPLLTRVKFNDIISNKNKTNKILIIIILILIFISLCLILIKTILSLTSINDILKILDMTINFEILKVDVYLEAVLSLDYCINEKNEIKKVLIPDVQRTKLKELMNHIKRIQDHISIITNNKNSLGIFNIIEEEIYIITKEDDWESNIRKTDLISEIRRLSYIIGNAINNYDDTCDIDIIYEFSILHNEQSDKNQLPPHLTQKQKLFFYFAYNALNTYKKTFEKLSEEYSSSLLKMWKIYETTQIYFIISVVIVLFIFFIIFCVKYCLDTSFYQLLFLYYYNINNEQKKFETQIYYLYKTNLEFNHENIKYFEFIKANYDNASNIYERENNNNNNNSDINYEEKIDLNKNDIIEQNSMNGSLLNSSMNGSSIQFLNRSNKLNLNNRIENNNYNTPNEQNPENNKSNEETIDNLIKFITNILPNSHRFSLFYIILNFLIYLGLCIIFIYEIINQMHEYDFSINLSMNILERVPRIMELVLYSTITVLLNQTTTLVPYNNHQSPYLQYFKIDSLYYSEEMLQNYYQNNLYGSILKDNLKLKYNLENYLFNNKYSLFKNVQYWETMLNAVGELWINLGKGVIYSDYINLSINATNLYELMQVVNNYALIFKIETPGMKNSGIKIEFNFILQEITTKYIEYVIYDRTNMDNLNEARQNFIDNSDFEKVINDIKLYLLFYFNTITYAVKNDFEEQNNQTTNNQITFSILFIIINIEIIISLIIIFSKGEKYKKLFSFFSTIPKSELINI